MMRPSLHLCRKKLASQCQASMCICGTRGKAKCAPEAEYTKLEAVTMQTKGDADSETDRVTVWMASQTSKCSIPKSTQKGLKDPRSGLVCRCGNAGGLRLRNAGAGARGPFLGSIPSAHCSPAGRLRSGRPAHSQRRAACGGSQRRGPADRSLRRAAGDEGEDGVGGVLSATAPVLAASGVQPGACSLLRADSGCSRGLAARGRRRPWS